LTVESKIDFSLCIRKEHPVLRTWFRSVLGVVMSVTALAQEGPATASTPASDQGKIDAAGKFVPASPAGTSTAPATPTDWREQAAGLIKKTGETTFSIGKIRCDRTAGSIAFPAAVNAREGLIEYALVTTKGKIHEALLSTEVSPLHLQMAALLLGWAPQDGSGKNTVPVTIDVGWETNGPAKKLPLEDLVALARESPQGKTGATLGRGPWQYQGSVIESGGFAAERDGSIISIISDPAALAANSRAGRDDDTLHVANTAALPTAAAPVTITIRPVTKSP
jgi:hypothetical protein